MVKLLEIDNGVMPYLLVERVLVQKV